MGLPHSEKARIDPRKISAYLLSTIHPVGRHKQRFFVAVGFSHDRPEDLVAALRRVAREGMLRDETATRYGTKYIVDGCVSALVGKGRSMIRNFDTVVLTRDLPEHGLRSGDMGAIVHDYAEGAYEVEFVTGGGTTLAVLTLEAATLRLLAPSDMLHVREVGRA